MKLTRLIIKNYKSLKSVDLNLNPEINIFVGNNDTGKSTLLESLGIITTGKLNGFSFDKQIRASLFNDETRREYINSLSDYKTAKEPPEIILEAFFDDEDKKYFGTNNENKEYASGIRVQVCFNQEVYGKIYVELLKNNEIFDIPIEFYIVKYRYFNSETVSYRFSPVKSVLIDTTRKDYSYLMDRFVSENITSYLTDQEQTDLSTAYRKSRHDFSSNDIVQNLNTAIKNNINVSNYDLSLNLKEESADEWKNQMAVVVNAIPFENIGFGSQNSIKIELALKNSEDQINVVLMEEPENNLSFTNMAKLIDHIQKSIGKQVFISTHSSYIANKLDLGNLFLIGDGKIDAFSRLPENVKEYFKKLSGYDTLRVVLADKVILVEGPTEELIIQRAYLDKFGKLPAANGIDVITISGLAFKRYCELAKNLKKEIIVVTDNDGDIDKNITKKYADYLPLPNFHIFYETNENLTTIEPSVVEANFVSDEKSKIFKKAISKNGSLNGYNKQGIIDFMSNNKAEWAMRVFDSDEKIIYPEYIQNAIKKSN